MLAGHARTVRYFEAVLAKGTLAHAYLFHGPEAVGKRTLAMAVAQSLLCSGKRQQGLGGCQTCGDCRPAAAGTHPDVTVLSPERPLVEEDLKRAPSARRAGIGIKNIHELQRQLALAPWRGGRRIILVDGAEALSRDAQTALLKTLEEPNASAVFFLVTDRPDALLPTIRSRSVPMGFATVNDAEIALLIGAIPPARRKLILAFAGGRPGLALRLAGDAKFFKEFQDAEARFAKVRRSHLGDQLAFSEQASREPETLAAFFNHLLSGERSLLHADLGAGEPGERARFVRSLLAKLSLLESTNVNRRLVADSVFVELATRA